MAVDHLRPCASYLDRSNTKWNVCLVQSVKLGDEIESTTAGQDGDGIANSEDKHCPLKAQIAEVILST